MHNANSRATIKTTKKKIGVIDTLRGEIKWNHTNVQLKLKREKAGKKHKKWTKTTAKL